MEQINIEVKALLVKYQAQEEKTLCLLRHCKVPLMQERYKARAQLLNEIIWDLKHVEKLTTV